mmetsp:Transcript_5877/g.7928  ORF Transcript_5877/g.7928 Transcript_5877/m.7928 type:complete len:126 (+) Transcript_5877:67-444(+)
MGTIPCLNKLCMVWEMLTKKKMRQEAMQGMDREQEETIQGMASNKVCMVNNTANSQVTSMGNNKGSNMANNRTINIPIKASDNPNIKICDTNNKISGMHNKTNSLLKDRACSQCSGNSKVEEVEE